jgi:hypothetical protein
MREHIIPSIVASVIASGAAIGFVHLAHKPVVNVVNSVSTKPVSDQKAAQLAKTVWPEMAQSDIDKLTAAVKDLPGLHRVTIFCVEEGKCGDLALNLDNAFESAHWQSDVVNYPMIQPGIMTGSKVLQAALIAIGMDAKLDESVRAKEGDAIAIGNRYIP